MALSVTRYRVQLSSSRISEKTNDPDPVFGKFNDGRTDGQTERRTRVISYDAVKLTSSIQKCSFTKNQSRPKSSIMST